MIAKEQRKPWVGIGIGLLLAGAVWMLVVRIQPQTTPVADVAPKKSPSTNDPISYASAMRLMDAMQNEILFLMEQESNATARFKKLWDASMLMAHKADMMQKEIVLLKEIALLKPPVDPEIEFAELSRDHTGGSVQSIKAGTMPLLLKYESAEPYLDGFRVFLTVGNPTGADVEFDLFWKTGTNRHKRISLEKPVKSGEWGKVDFPMHPATAQDLNDFQVGLRIRNWSLRRAN